ncbi:MAG: formate dehydrogenase subunit alpha [Actinobacteria bacterium]|nr:formate dehydrogenase subunit alpha [Actinomycetota bacterium]
MKEQNEKKTVMVIIDGHEVTVDENATVLDAARQAGVEIPTLCHLDGITDDSNCRMCQVDWVRGASARRVFACDQICRDGMVIETHNDSIDDDRRFILGLLLDKHDVQCLNCSSMGQCKLADYCYEYGVEKKDHPTCNPLLPVDESNPFFVHNPNLCIDCRICERVCTELSGRKTITTDGRGYDMNIGVPFGHLWIDSNCESCGNCVENCPTGALSRKRSTHYRPWEVTRTRTTCSHCGAGCQLNLLVKDGKLVGAEAADGAANRGRLCVKGRFGSDEFVHAVDRLTYPLVKRDGVLQRATWDEAIVRVVEGLSAVREAHGADAIAGFSCSRATNEDNYVFQKMVRSVFGTNNVDNCARVCHSASVAGLAKTLGSGAMTNTIRDVTEDVDAILLVGSNPEEAHPVIGMQIRRAVDKGAKLIVVDPRKIDLAERAAYHLQIRPGTNIAFANGMMHIMIEEDLIDHAFIEERAENYDALKAMVASYTPARVAEICHIDAADLIEATRLYATAHRAPIIYCLGVTEHSMGTEGVMSLSNIALLAGKFGRPGCGVNPLRGQNNVQGACDMGCLPTDFPGYQKVADPAVVEKFEKAWDCQLSSNPGLTSTEALAAAVEGHIKGLYIFGEDPIRTDPDTSHVRKALENVDFLVVQDIYMTKTAEYADVVLPGISYAEKEGTFANTERRVQRVRKAVTLEGEMRDDYVTFCEVMTKMGYPSSYADASEIMDEIASVTPSYGGISFERLDAGEDLQWPCPTKDHPGTPIMHVGRFTRGVALFYPAEYRPSQELPDSEYPLLMTTGRMLYHYNSGNMTHRVPGLDVLAGESYIEINADDADRLGIADGSRVSVSSRRGHIDTTARVGDKMYPGEVFMTFHFDDGNVNEVTNAVLDEFARIPEYKVCAVDVTPAN